MGGLKALVIFLGVVILAMMGTLVVGLAYKVRAPSGGAPASLAASLVLDEPSGTRIQSISPSGGYLAVLLQGGGVDRVVFIDPVGDRVVGRVLLRR